MMEALVGVHVGFVQKLLKEIPLFLMASMLGVFGFILPSVKPFMASLPKSSAIIKRILGVSELDISVLFPSSFEHENTILIKAVDINKTNFNFFLL